MSGSECVCGGTGRRVPGEAMWFSGHATAAAAAGGRGGVMISPCHRCISLECVRFHTRVTQLRVFAFDSKGRERGRRGSCRQAVKTQGRGGRKHGAVLKSHCLFVFCSIPLVGSFLKKKKKEERPSERQDRVPQSRSVSRTTPGNTCVQLENNRTRQTRLCATKSIRAKHARACTHKEIH